MLLLSIRLGCCCFHDVVGVGDGGIVGVDVVVVIGVFVGVVVGVVVGVENDIVVVVEVFAVAVGVVVNVLVSSLSSQLHECSIEDQIYEGHRTFSKKVNISGWSPQ